jgi:hypothetical protein
LDLEEGHIGKLVDDLGGSGAEVAAASLWAQSLMDRRSAQFLAGREAGWVREQMPVSVMSAEEVARVLEGMTEEVERPRTIVEAGAIPPLVRLLGSGRGREAEFAAGALWGLALRSENWKLVLEAGGIGPLVALLSSGKGAEADYAASTLRNLTLRPNSQKLIVQAGVVGPLVRLLSSGKGGEAENAAATLWHLAQRAETRPMIADAGAIPPLVMLLSSEKGVEALMAAGTLAGVAEYAENLHRIATTPRAIPLLVRAGLRVGEENVPGMLSRLSADPALARLFDQSLVRTRTLLATRKDMLQSHLKRLEKWYPALADEIRGYESFDAWKVHVERCDLRRLLLSWRRGVVEAENAASDLEATSLREKMADGTAVVAELPPTNTSSSDGGEVAAASGLGPR